MVFTINIYAKDIFHKVEQSFFKLLHWNWWTLWYKLRFHAAHDYRWIFIRNLISNSPFKLQELSSFTSKCIHIFHRQRLKHVYIRKSYVYSPSSSEDKTNFHVCLHDIYQYLLYAKYVYFVKKYTLFNIWLFALRACERRLRETWLRRNNWFFCNVDFSSVNIFYEVERLTVMQCEKNKSVMWEFIGEKKATKPKGIVFLFFFYCLIFQPRLVNGSCEGLRHWDWFW